MFLTNPIGITLILVGMMFLLAGTIGLLRFPDVYTRLHVLTKADNVGLGLVAAGIALQSLDWIIVLKLLLIWILLLVSSATTSHIIARAAMDTGIEPVKEQDL